MLRVLICHARQDSAAALALAQALELRAEARVSLAATGADAPDVLHLWDAEDADAVVLLLAPECVPSQSSRTAWQPVLDHVESRARPGIGAVLLRACPYPKLLERTPFCRHGLDRQCERTLEAWLLGLHPDPGWPDWAVLHPTRPAAPGRQADVERLWAELADNSGWRALSGPAAPPLAQLFAADAAAQFRAALFLDAHERPAPCLAGELASALGVRAEESVEDAWARIATVLDAHRLLLILDGWEGALPWPPNPARRTSILTLAPRILPPAPAPDPSPLWPAASACRPNGFPLALAARIAGLPEDQARQEASLLCEQGLLAGMDPFNSRYRRLAAGSVSAGLRRAHAQALDAIFLDRDRGATLAALCVAELESAFPFAAGHDWSLAVSLANRANRFFEHHGRRLEAVHFLRLIVQACQQRGDRRNEADFRQKLAWLVDDAGELRKSWEPGQQGSLFN
jgi:hypothetical protein